MCWCGFRGAYHDVALVRRAVGVLDGSEPCGYPGLPGGNGLAVASAVRVLGQALTSYALLDISSAYGPAIVAAPMPAQPGTEAILSTTETAGVRMQGVSGCRRHIESDYRRPEHTGY